MDEILDLPKPHRPFLAGFWLIAAIPVSILIVLPFATIIDLEVDESIGLTAVFLVHFAAGFMWARSLGRRTGRSDNRMMNLAAGIGFTLFVWGGRAAFVAFDPIISRWFRIFQGAVHLEFGAIFVVWTGLVTGGTGLAVGTGLRDWKLALKLLGLGLVSGAGVFLVVAFLMDLIGFRVGTPRADEIPSMVVTTLLGIWGAALVGTALFGKMLARTDSAG